MSEALVSVFQGRRLTSIPFRGQYVWVAREVAELLGYEDPSNLVDLIGSQWRADFPDDRFRLTPRGADLADFKAAAALGGYCPPSRAPSLLLLTEAGLYRVLMKTDKPAGVDIRGWLSTEVLPKLARTGSYGLPSAPSPRSVPADAHEQRKMIEAQASLARAQVRQGIALRQNAQLLRDAGHGDKDMYAALLVKSAALIAGESYTYALPEDTRADWISPEQIAKELTRDLGAKVTAHRVGTTISNLGLREKPQYERAIVNVAPGTSRQITSYLWSPAAVDLVRAEIEKWAAAQRPPSPAPAPISATLALPGTGTDGGEES